MIIKAKLTFKLINLVKLKNYLLIFNNNNIEKYILVMELPIKLFIFIIYL